MIGSNVVNGPGAATAGVNSWNVSGTTIHYTMVGENPGHTSGLAAPDGANIILFNDPNNFLACCPGAVAIGGISNSSGPYVLAADGLTYNNQTEVDVVVEKNASIPTFVDQALLAGLLTHEVGHTLGFRHSDGTASPSSPPPSCDASVGECAGPTQAVMAHIVQAPATTLQTWDRNAAQTVYGSGPACTPPSISVQPQSQTITSGESAILTVTAGGSTPLTYQWYIGSTGDTSSLIAGGTNSSITVSPTSTTSYWVRVTGQCSPTADSATATITVNPCTPPSISVQPQSQTITSGQSANLSVTATGSTPLTYQWYIGASGNTSQETGTNSSTLTVSPTSTTQYWVRVSGLCSPTADSATATITVNPAPCTPVSITIQPQSTQITAGQSAFLSVQVAGSSPFTYQWFTGTPPGGTAIPGATGASVSVSPTTTTSYYVHVTNCSGANSVTSSAATVSIAAGCTGVGQVTASASPTSINAGQQVALLATVGAGTQPFAFQWFRGTSGDQSNPIPGATSFSLTDSPTTTTSYWVRVTNCNGANSANSNTVTVTVTPGGGCTAPSITAHPQSVTIVIGATTTLSVAAAGSAPLHFAWFQGTTGDQSRPVVGSDSASFTTPPLKTQTQYWLKVSNECSTTTASSFTATVSVKSGRPRAVRH